MELKGPSDAGTTALRSERRDHVPDQPHEPAPAVIVELGRSPDLAPTYNARGMLQGAPVPGRAVPAGIPPPAPNERVPVTAAPAITAPAPAEVLRVPANAQVHTLTSASPQVAAALRPTVPLAPAHLHPPPLAVMAGIQPLAPEALKQTEKGNAAAEHEEDADPLREEKEPPPTAARRRPR